MDIVLDSGTVLDTIPDMGTISDMNTIYGFNTGYIWILDTGRILGYGKSTCPILFVNHLWFLKITRREGEGNIKFKILGLVRPKN